MEAKIKVKTKRWKTTDLAFIALFVALMAICSWISIPAAVPFTLQTFAVFAAVGILGGKRGTLAVVVYILLGLVGIPVFSGFNGGPGILFGGTGGYILGFLFSALFMWAMEKLPGNRKVILLVSMIAGLFVCYAFGTAWFMVIYMRINGAVSLLTVLGWCVFPFLLPDLGKIAVAMLVSARVAPRVKSYVEG